MVEDTTDHPRRRTFARKRGSVSKQEALELCKNLFSREPSIRRIERDFLKDDEGDWVMDLTFLVDGDLFDSETRVIPLVIELMRRLPEVPVDFVVLPASARPQAGGQVVYSRDS